VLAKGQLEFRISKFGVLGESTRAKNAYLSVSEFSLLAALVLVAFLAAAAAFPIDARSIEGF